MFDRNAWERARRAAETPEQREERLAKRRARYRVAEWVEKHRADCKTYYLENKEKFKEYERRKKAKPDYAEKTRLYGRRKAGVVDATAEMRSGACSMAACDYVGPLVLDHDHATGAFRGWLCSNCNAGLGFYKDSPERLRAAADYLELHAGVGWPKENT